MELENANLWVSVYNILRYREKLNANSEIQYLFIMFCSLVLEFKKSALKIRKEAYLMQASFHTIVTIIGVSQYLHFAHFAIDNFVL